jgi:transposase
LERLRARNAKLEAELTKTRTALDIMGKAHALLEQLSESADDQTPPTRPRKH